MKVRYALVLSIASSIIAMGCGERRGATVTAFGESTGRTVAEFVEYFDEAAASLDQHLGTRDFSPTNKPPKVDESGSSFVAQRDTWYEGTGPNAGAIHVKVRQPTENATGLHVYVVWRAEGASTYVDSVEKDAQAIRVQLTEWWDEYKRRKPRGAK
jgi:hypothetical protein